MRKFEVKLIYITSEDLEEDDVKDIFENLLESNLDLDVENYGIGEVEEI